MNEQTRPLTTAEELAQLDAEIPALEQLLNQKEMRYKHLWAVNQGLVFSAEKTAQIQRGFDEDRRRKEEAQLALEEAARREATEARQAELERARQSNERIRRQHEERENYIRSMSPPR